MKALVSTILVLFGCTARANTEYIPSGRAKAFKGPEGEVVTLVPLNQNSKMLILAHNTYGPANDKVLVYNFSAPYNAGILQPDKARDPDHVPQLVVLNKTDNQWTYSDFLESRKILRIQLTYSEELSDKIHVKDLLGRATEATRAEPSRASAGPHEVPIRTVPVPVEAAQAQLN